MLYLSTMNYYMLFLHPPSVECVYDMGVAFPVTALPWLHGLYTCTCTYSCMYIHVLYCICVYKTSNTRTAVRVRICRSNRRV